MEDNVKPVWTLLQVGHFGSLNKKEFDSKEALLEFVRNRFDVEASLYVASPSGHVKPISWNESYKEEMIPIKRFIGLNPNIF